MTVIAIDGTFSSGKGTLAKRLAKHYGFAYLDTGKLYRTVAYKAMSMDISLEDGTECAKLAKAITPTDLNDPILKSGPVGAAASKVSVHKRSASRPPRFSKTICKQPEARV